jgi:peptide deformylase
MAFDLLVIEDHPHSHILTQPSAEVSFPLTQEERGFIGELKERSLGLGGVGLAAPQLGIHKRIIIININKQASLMRNNAEVVEPTILINPTYTPAQDAIKLADWEGCFSVRETYGKVPRYNKINYRAQTETGEIISGKAEGFTARVLQHEIDHINGILMTDRLTSDCLYGHPDHMLPIRISEFNAEQKAIYDDLMAKKK